MTQNCKVGRLAPSPTGFLHLGNAFSFLLAWLECRSKNGKIVLRIDDIDPARSKPEYIRTLREDLQWLGLDWDAEYRQSQRTRFYEQALDWLEDRDLIYRCFCTRKELRMLANAPHIGDIGAPYPGICRNLDPAIVRANILQGKAFCLRFKCPAQPVHFNDLIYGPQEFSALDTGGDFALKRSDGVFAYQLASVVDDGDMGINIVVRGRDILPSTARQIMLQKALDLPVPCFAHTPLILDETGERLAKRHASLSLKALRENGVTASQICGFLGMLAGSNPYGFARTASDLLPAFDLQKAGFEDISLHNAPKWLSAK